MMKVFSLGIQDNVKNVSYQRSPECKLLTLYWLLYCWGGGESKQHQNFQWCRGKM